MFVGLLAVNLSGWARESGSSDQLVQSAQSNLAYAYQQCQERNLISAGLKTPLPGYPLSCGPAGSTPMNQPSRKSLVVPVFPAIFFPSFAAARAVPLCTTFLSISVIT